MGSAAAATRVVITGVGVVSPIGVGNAAFWESLIEGRGGIGLLQSYPRCGLPSPLAAEVLDFDPMDFLPTRKLLKVMSRDIQLGVAASHLAVTDAGLDRGVLAPERVGVSFGAGRISTQPLDLLDAATFSNGERPDLAADCSYENGLGRVNPMWLLKRMPNMPACHVSIGLDARGPNNTITSRDASPLLALAEAVRVIERGAADCMIAGGCGSSTHPTDIAKLTLYGTLSKETTDPARGCRPFDAERDGTVLGEGAGAFVIERLEHARDRGADIYAEILGVGAGSDGSRRQNGREGEGLVHAVTAAMADAGLGPGDLGHLNANGTGGPREDRVEAWALGQALGETAARLPLTALKSYLGNSDAGSGAVELAGSLLALKHGCLPATLGYTTPDPDCPLDVVHGEPRPLERPIGLAVNRTDVGQAAAVIVGRL